MAKPRKAKKTHGSVKKLVHLWKDGARIKADPNVVADIFKKIRAKHKGKLPNKAIVAEAKKVRSPLHNEFIWDDRKAAEAQRLDHAGYLVRSLEIKKARPTKKGEPIRYVKVRAYASLGKGAEDGQDSAYWSIEEILADAEQRSRLMLKVLHRLLALKKEYAALTELSRVWIAIDEVGGDIAKSA